MNATQSAEERAWDALANWLDNAPRSALEALTRGVAWQSIIPGELHALVASHALDVAAIARQELGRWHRIARVTAPAEVLVWCASYPVAAWAD